MPVAGHPYDLASLTTTSGGMAALGCPALLPLEVRIRPEHARGRGSEPLFRPRAPRPVRRRRSYGRLEAAARPRRSPRRGDTGRSRQAIAVPATRPHCHPLADLTGIALGLGRARPDRVTGDFGHRAVTGPAHAPPAAAAGVVVGLGIGVEYLPVLVSLVVIFWLCSSVIARRDLYRFAAGGAGALAFCFGPLLATYLGRTSLAGGLSFTVSVASIRAYARPPRVASSLWAIFDLSPGKVWLLAALSTSVALMIVLTHRARRDAPIASGWEYWRLVVLPVRDPPRSGALPQFSVSRPRLG